MAELLPLRRVSGSVYSILAYNGPAIRIHDEGEIAIRCDGQMLGFWENPADPETDHFWSAFDVIELR